MRYSLYVNQPLAIKLGIKNINQAHIFDLLMTAPAWADPVIINNTVYYWVARQKICKELELLHLKPDTVYRHLKDLDLLRLIDYIKHQKKDCMKITTKGKGYMTSKNTMSEIDPNHYIGNESEKDNNSEIDPKKLGNKSEFNSEINPTYPYTKVYPYTNDPLSKRAINNFDSFVSHIRANYINKEIIQTKDRHTSKVIRISVSQNGYLYDINSSEDFKGSRAKEIWKSLYDIARKGELNDS